MARGGIVVSGSSYIDGSGNTDTQNHLALVRYNSNGSIDASFGAGYVLGAETTDFSDLGFSTESASGLMLDPNGRLIVTGTATQSGYSSFAVACYDPGLATLTVPVMYDPPVLQMVVSDQVIEAGSKLSLPTMAMFSNEAGNFTFTYSIDWGDGSTSGGTPTIIYAGGGSALLVGQFGDTSPNAYAPGIYRGVRHSHLHCHRQHHLYLGHPDYPIDGGFNLGLAAGYS